MQPALHKRRHAETFSESKTLPVMFWSRGCCAVCPRGLKLMPVAAPTAVAGSQVMGANTVGANTSTNSNDLDLNYGGFASRAPAAQAPPSSSSSSAYAPAYGGYGAAPSHMSAGGGGGGAQMAPVAQGHGGGGGYYAAPQPQLQPSSVSLIDQVPAAAPSYPAYFQHASAPQPQVCVYGGTHGDVRRMSLLGIPCCGRPMDGKCITCRCTPSSAGCRLGSHIT